MIRCCAVTSLPSPSVTRPAIVRFVELRRHDIRVQLDIAAQVEAVGHVVRVAQDLGLARVALGPLPLLLQRVGERVGILHALDVAARARIAVPVPRAADARAALVDARRHAEPAQPVQHVEAGETGADDDGVVVLNARHGARKPVSRNPWRSRRSRTPDLRFRKPLLYPAELRDRAWPYSMRSPSRNPISFVKSQRSAARLEWRAGCAYSLSSPSRRMRGSGAPQGAPT